MSTIDLYLVLKKIPNVTDEEAKQAAAATEQTDRLQRIETKLVELEAQFRTTSRITLGLQLIILAILLIPLYQ